ncbi:MAG TPA: helix-turn-helix domain-containing protein [Streptosporangiaceae bacterium]
MSESDAAAVADDIHAISRLLRRSVLAQTRRLPVPLTPPQAQAMQELVEAHRDGAWLTVSQLSARMGLAHSTVSGIVTRLVRLGLVRRTTRADDRRHVRIELADQVRDWVARDLPRLRRRPLALALAGMAGEQAAALRDGLALLRQLLETMETGETGETGRVEVPEAGRNQEGRTS